MYKPIELAPVVIRSHREWCADLGLPLEPEPPVVPESKVIAICNTPQSVSKPELSPFVELEAQMNARFFGQSGAAQAQALNCGQGFQNSFSNLFGGLMGGSPYR